MGAEIGLRGPQDDTCSISAGGRQQSQMGFESTSSSMERLHWLGLDKAWPEEQVSLYLQGVEETARLAEVR